MAESVAGASAAERPGGVKLAHEWILIAVTFAAFVGLGVAEIVVFRDETRAGRFTPLSFAQIAVAALGQALWITMDRKRRGLEVGWWRFGAILLGPLVIWLYLALEYRLKALYLIPLSLLVFVASGIAIVAAGVAVLGMSAIG